MKCYFHDSLENGVIFQSSSHSVDIQNLSQFNENDDCNLSSTVDPVHVFFKLNLWSKMNHKVVVNVSPSFKLLIQGVESMSVSVCLVLSAQSHFIKRSEWMMCLCESVWGRAGRWMWRDTNSEWALTHCWRAEETHVHTCPWKALTVALLHTGQRCFVLQKVQSLVRVWV